MTKRPEDYRYVQPVKVGTKTYYYLRFRKLSAKLPGPGPGFKAAYDKALGELQARAEEIATGHAGKLAQKKEASSSGSLRAAVDAYLKDAVLFNHETGKRAAAGTVKGRRRLLNTWCNEVAHESGHLQLKDITSKALDAKLNKMKRAKPGEARNTRSAMRSFFAYCTEVGLVEEDPSQLLRAKMVAASEDGFRIWPQEHVDTYRAHHKPDSLARFVFELLYGSGAADCDAVRLSPANIKDGIFEYTRQKTGEDAWKPVSPELQAMIAARAPKGTVVSLTQPFLLNAEGNPVTAKLLSAWVSRFAAEAGIPAGFTAHGIRKRAATDDLEAGCNPAEMKAMYGWSTSAMVDLYTKKYNRRAAAQAVVKRRQKA